MDVGTELEPAQLLPRKGLVLGMLCTCFSTVFLGFFCFLEGFFVFWLWLKEAVAGFSHS